tara:strand:- start:47 stop:283 length:237 start_codon:yes stop_codon:yes gene_type:complete
MKLDSHLLLIYQPQEIVMKEYQGVRHHGLDYYLREILQCTEESEMGVCETNAVHSAGYLYEDFAAAIKEFLESSKETV